MKKPGKQIVFEQKVFRANEVFRRKMNDLIIWHKSPSESRQYPEKSQTNRCTYRKHAHLYLSMINEKNILYKKVTNADGIGRWSLYFISSYQQLKFSFTGLFLFQLVFLFLNACKKFLTLHSQDARLKL